MNKFIYVLNYDEVPHKAFKTYKDVVQYLRKEFYQTKYDESFEWWSCLNLSIDEDKKEHGFEVHIGYFDDILIDIHCVDLI